MTMPPAPTAPAAAPAPTSRRIAAAFQSAAAAKRKALILYLTASDPDFETSRRLMLAAAASGADLLEVGVPWSDPSADGPAIQGAMQRALAAGGGLGRSLELCRAVRAENDVVPLVLFGYANPIVVMEPARFSAAAKAAGADAVLCVDWPPDEDDELTGALARVGLDLIPLLAPTSTPARIATAGAVAGGFLYYVSLTGITGASLTDMDGPRQKVQEIRRATGGRLPVVVGFGVSTPDDARRVAAFADGVVIGSAAVRIIERARKEGRDPVPDVAAFVASVRAAL